MAAADIVIGAEDDVPSSQLGAMSNRHGLVAGATGTGKTVTLQVLAEGFSRMGVPVFAADVKGDLSGIAATGQAAQGNRSSPRHWFRARIISSAVIPSCSGTSTGERSPGSHDGVGSGTALARESARTERYAERRAVCGVPYRRRAGTVAARSEGPEGVARVDGRASSELRAAYGNITAASVGAIQRGLLVLEEQGADRLFGEPALSLADLMQIDFSGNGVVSLLDATQLVQNAPRVYAALLLWLLSELFEDLPEVGRRRSTEARVVLRRGAPVVRWRAEAAARQDRAGGAADPFEGRRRLLRHAESARYAGDGARTARSEGASTRCARSRRRIASGHQVGCAGVSREDRAWTSNASSPNSKPAKR